MKDTTERKPVVVSVLQMLFLIIPAKQTELPQRGRKTPAG